MKIHFFYKRDYHPGFYDLEIVAWLEEKVISRQGDERLNFTELERLNIYLSKSTDFHVHRIRHEFGKDSCLGHYAHTRKKLVAAMEEQEFKSIDRRNYERFRKVALALYHRQTLVDFSDFKGKQKYTIRHLLGD